MKTGNRHFCLNKKNKFYIVFPLISKLPSNINIITTRHKRPGDIKSPNKKTRWQTIACSDGLIQHRLRGYLSRWLSDVWSSVCEILPCDCMSCYRHTKPINADEIQTSARTFLNTLSNKQPWNNPTNSYSQIITWIWCWIVSQMYSRLRSNNARVTALPSGPRICFI
jgi:hypothetical protein